MQDVAKEESGRAREREYINSLVSVIIPLFNAEKYIEGAILSIINQTYDEIEVVVVDDCSTDNSPEIVKKLSETSSCKINYYRLEYNQGAGIARNKALELARGRFVAFLDSDDIWLPEKIEKQMKLMREYNCPFSYAAIEMIDENGNTLKGKRKLREKCDYHYLLHNTLIATSSVVIDREVVGDFRMNLRRGGQDYATWLSILRSGFVARGIDETLVRYRLSSGSLSSNKLKSVKQIWQIQTEDEKIPKIKVAFNIFCYAMHAIKKYFF